MKLLLANLLFVGLTVHAACGQGAQADMVKRRAKETVNQNNVRQGVPAPAQAPTQPPAAAAPGTAVTQTQSLAKLKTDLAGFKTGSVATAAQKQQFTIDLAQAARGNKPSLGTVKKLVDSLTAALTGATLATEHQVRLAQNLDAVFNAKPFPITQFDKIIEDTQAILEVGTDKRTIAMSVAADLKAVGLEVRR